MELRGVTVIALGNEFCDLSSNPGQGSLTFPWH